MTKVAIVTRKMITGGVERALIAMLRQFEYSKTEVDLFVSDLGGELEAELPEEVRLMRLQPISLKDCGRKPELLVQKVWNRLLLAKKQSYIMQCYHSSKLLQPIAKEYDIAIAYHAPNTVPVFFTLDGIKAKKKVLWLHGDLDTNAGHTEIAKRYHARYDQVFAVSQAALDSFLHIHPERADHAALFYNFVDVAGIRQKADIGPTFQDEFMGTRIVSVGRLDPQKGFDWAIEACRKLVDDGYAVRWYICGEGDQRKELETLIAENHLSDTFILLGNQPNPYGYMKNCDLYVQTSRFEGYCTTTNEARMLGKSVITTDVSGAREQFIHDVTGWIVPLNAEAIYKQICECLYNQKKVKNVSDNLQKASYQRLEHLEKLFL